MEWHRPRVLGNGISARIKAGTCAVGNRVYIYGGWGYPENVINDDPDNNINQLVGQYSAGLYYIDIGAF